MEIHYSKITIIHSRKPNKLSINQKLQWFANSLGLFNLRDKDNSMFRIFIELIKSAKVDRNISSDELALKLNLTRGTVVHHLHKLIESGLVISQKNRYYLRVNSLTELVDEVEKDVNRTLSDLRKVADDLDGQLGL